MTVLGRLGKLTVVSVKVSPERLITSEYRWQQSLSEGLGWDKKRAQEYSSRCFLFPVSHDLSGLSPLFLLPYSISPQTHNPGGQGLQTETFEIITQSK